MFVKIPAIEEGIRAMEILSKKGYNITATVVGSFGQGMAALKAGAKYVAVFYGPMESKGMNPCAVIKRLAAYIQASGCEGRILAAGCKDLEACGKAMKAGATAFTVDPDDVSCYERIRREFQKGMGRRTWDWRKHYGPKKIINNKRWLS